MNLKEIKILLEDEPAFRFKQVKQFIFQDLIEDWAEALNLPLKLRELLNQEHPLKLEAQESTSKNKSTVKALITLHDGLKVETVLMRHKDRNTVCVSSQIGCPLGCSFCATGKMGYKRNLDSGEIIDQVLYFARYLKKRNQKISNIVFMGMGEPFLNYENVMRAIDILNDEQCFNIGARRISISTVGITEGIDKLANENIQINLAISLHAPNDDLRLKIMPINKSYPLKKVISAVDNYMKKTNRKVMFEYIMIDGVNDQPKQARELVELIKGSLSMVNLIPYNPTGVYNTSSQENMEAFKKILEKEGVNVTLRRGFGPDIEGACGQLASKK